MRLYQIVMTALATAGLAACGSTLPGDSVPGALFTALPLSADRIVCVHPVGEIGVPGDVLGANRSRWDVREHGACGTPAAFSGEPVQVFAAARGTVVTVTNGGGGRVTIAVTTNIEYTYTGVALDGFITEGTVVPAGQRVGLVANPDSGITFGVADYTFVNEWIATPRYPDAYRHARHPVRYYDGARRTTIESRMSSGAPEGRLVWDVAGSLAGNWFVDGTPRTAAAVAPAYWEGHLSFRGDARFPEQPRIGMGTLLSGGCRCAPRQGEPAFANVNLGSGPVAYHLVRVNIDGTPTSTLFGTMLVEMLAADRIRAELFVGDIAAPAFTAAAVSYVR